MIVEIDILTIISICLSAFVVGFALRGLLD